MFDNIERGSLKEHLNGNSLAEVLYVHTSAKIDSLYWLADPLRTPLNWRTRLQIAIGVVAALVCEKQS